MGCGGSTVYSEDGAVVPGQGEVNIKWSAEKPVEVGFYYYTEKDAKILVKEFPMDKECAEKQFEDKNVVSSNGGVHWVKVVPGNRYGMKYVEGGHSVAFPGQKALELPKKIHAFHTKDEAATDKLVTDLKKDVEKVEGHAYKAEGADDKIKTDIASLGGFNTCADFPEEMPEFKKACKLSEDLQPWNTISACVAVKQQWGHYAATEGAPLKWVGGLSEMAKKAGEEKLVDGPSLMHTGLSKGQKAFSGIIEGAVKGACKKAGPELEELAPNMKDRLDNMDGCVPGVDRAEKRAKKEEEKKEGEAEKKDEKKDDAAESPECIAAGKQYEADKPKLKEWKAEDGKDLKGDAESYLKAVYGSISNVDAAPDADKAVIANIKGFQAPVFVTAVEGDEVTVTTAANNFQDESSIKIPKQFEGTTVNGTTAEDSKADAFTSLPDAAKDEWLKRGQGVFVRNKKEFSEGWVMSVEGDTVTIEDQFKQKQTAKKEDVFTHLTQQQVASRGVALMPKFAPMQFWWVAGEDTEENKIAVRKVRVWRYGAPDSVQEFDLTPKKIKAKPTEAVKEPTNEVHIGFSADVDILLGAEYAYNFQIGEEFFVDFDKKIENNKGCKVFTSQARVEYGGCPDV